jgi:hypothetical protein
MFQRMKADVSSYINPSVSSTTPSVQRKQVRVGPASSRSVDEEPSATDTMSHTNAGGGRELYLLTENEIPEERDIEVEEFNDDEKIVDEG